jgi:prophage DNA circulation protein
MRTAISIGLSVIGVLTGCSNEVWVKAGMTQSEYQKDSYECGQNAGVNVGSSGSSLDAAQQAKSAISRCMTALGYTLQKADSVDPALKLVNCKFKEVDQVQRLSAQSCTNSGGTVVDDAD